MNTAQKWNGFGPPVEVQSSKFKVQSSTLLGDAPKLMLHAQAQGLISVRPPVAVQSSKFKVRSSIHGRDARATTKTGPKARRCARCDKPSGAIICFDCQTQIYRCSPAAQELLRLVCETFALGAAAILSKTRLAHIAEARQVFAYCLHQFCGWNYNRLARFIGQDHGTSAYAVHAIAGRLQVYPGLRQKVSLIEQRLSRGTVAQTAAAAPQVSTAPAAATPKG